RIRQRRIQGLLRVNALPMMPVTAGESGELLRLFADREPERQSTLGEGIKLVATLRHRIDALHFVAEFKHGANLEVATETDVVICVLNDHQPAVLRGDLWKKLHPN